MIVKLLTERHLEFLSFKGGCGGSSESTHVKMQDCWKSHATAHLQFYAQKFCLSKAMVLQSNMVLFHVTSIGLH